MLGRNYQPTEYASEADAVDSMRHHYVAKGWEKFGGFYGNGGLPVPYILPKYKDVVADCATVHAKKGV